MSVGSSQLDASDIALFQSAVDQAVAGNVCMVASAGNDDSSQPVYPAACNGVLAVASTQLTPYGAGPTEVKRLAEQAAWVAHHVNVG